MANSGGVAGNLKISSSQITNLCVSVTDMSYSDLQSKPCDQSPIFEELKRCSNEANQIVSSIINVTDDLQSYREQLTGCDVSIPILCQTEQPSFQQVIDSGKVKLKLEESYYFFIDLISQDGLGIMRSLWDSGAKSSVSCNRYLMDQRYFLNEKLPNQRSIQTVGAEISQANLHRVLIPVTNLNHTHYMTHTLGVDKIIDPIPYKDMKNVMDKAYESYVHSVVGSGAVPLPYSQWPDGLMGGPVHFLLGVSDLNFKLIFEFYGLILFLTI